MFPKPSKLEANFPSASGGTGLLGIGFVIEPDMYNEWIRQDTRYADILRPYVNGRELNAMVDTSPERYVIDFGDRTEQEAESFPLALDRVRELVKPNRDKLTRQIHEACYWKHWDKRADLYASIQTLRRVLVCGFVSKHLSFTFLPVGWIYSKELVVVPTEEIWAFAALQSSAHFLWAQHQSGTLKSDLSYSISDALRTFPLPRGDLSLVDLTGTTFYNGRTAVIRGNAEGLTKTYNRFHDPHEKSPEILKLRELHEAMDRAVLEAYGWHDLAQNARCEFLLDYEEDDEETGKKKSKKKKPWRLRWPDDFRDEVLARLLELNEQRHKEELLAGKQLGKAAKPPKPAKASQPKKPRKAATRDLFTSALEPGHRSLLMLLRAWNGRAVTRRLLNEGLILMLDDKLRSALVETGSRPKGRRKATPDLNPLFTELEIDGFIEQVPSAHQQAWRVTATAPTTDDASPEEVRRLTETMQYLNRAQSAGQITVSEETVDANVDLIPA